MRRQDSQRAVSRRAFLRAGALGGIGAALAAGALPAAVLAQTSAKRTPRPMPRVPLAAGPHADLEEATLAQLQQRLQSGQLTSHALCTAYLARIQALDRRGPTLRAVIETNPEALQIAAQLDRERQAGKVRGPLHGIPVLVKDNIATADRMKTTAGSLALEAAVVTRDSFVAERLRAAGAILLGKTNLSEWANFRSSQSSSGWSARGGQCRNPYVLDRSPCGSSSGTGAAIAASLAAVGVGTETDGSIVCPSGMNGLVGLKPTVGLISRAGIIPISHTQDTAGPMARTVTDAAILLNALAGADPRDAATVEAAGHIAPDYTQFLDAKGLQGARLGVVRAKFFGYSPETDAVIEKCIEDLRRLGAVIVDPVEIPHLGEYDEAEFAVLLYEFKTDLNAYLADLAQSPVRTLEDIIAFNKQNAGREMAWFGQDLFEKAQAKGPLTDKDYLDALEKCQRLSRTEGLDAVFAPQQLDALIAPTGAPAWTIDLVNGDHFLGASSTPAAVSGYPTITVPAGESFGLPVGLTFIGTRWSEGTLLRLAYAYEQALSPRKPPRFDPTVDTSRG